MTEIDHRITYLFSERSTQGQRILYWMQASVRIRHNLALMLARREAISRRLPLEVLFCLDSNYPEANARSFAMLLDGLEDVSRRLEYEGLKLTVALGSAETLVKIAGRRAAVVFFDQTYLPFGRRQRMEIASELPCPVVVAEDNATVPVRLVSDKEEWSAATLRPKLMRLASAEPFLPQIQFRDVKSRAEEFRTELAETGVHVLSQRPDKSLLQDLELDSSVFPVSYPGGETAAWKLWESFRDHKLDRYEPDRNDPTIDGQSGLSPALHFGHISPLSLVEDLKRRGLWKEPVSYRKAGGDSVSKFLDELLVRRELSFNFVLFNPHHASLLALPDWAFRTLRDHGDDRREAVYVRDDWENARTHDRVWNAAQTQLVRTGILHGYMRMYWGKKLLEWSATPEQAYLDALYLNNKYALDGRDPNSVAGVAWCFGKHDRPWGERSVYGTVRCMTEGGLRKKFDVDEYVRRYSLLGMT